MYILLLLFNITTGISGGALIGTGKITGILSKTSSKTFEFKGGTFMKRSTRKRGTCWE
ncbi:hypothetical protein [Clostridium peptidivorans]|uniref:hypothetical protein n=1 Tax=Clostridium peptidivorans TaxID=100174 RepID=UPI0015C9AEF5|nr:hypothetical protein [Clostridium peptidivorans]